MNNIEICNLALGRIGVEEINRMDEASNAARICTRYFDFTRQNVLRRFPWTFATKRVQLAQLDETAPDFQYVYQYPADALAVRLMYNEHFVGLPKDNHFRLMNGAGGRKIYCDIPNAWIEYTADVKDSELFDAQFVEAFSWKLASEMAFSLTGNMNLATNAIQAYNAYFTEAAGEDAAEDNQEEIVQDRLVNARWGEGEFK